MPGCSGRITPAELRRIARHVLSAEGAAREVEVEVVLADEETVRDLNRLYRGHDEPTDVLSFSAVEGEPLVSAPGEAPSLGEVVVCLPVTEARALARGLPTAGEVAHLLVHGLLHLLGHDHELGEDHAARMQVREDELLSLLSYGGQYAHGHED